jgi:hypothetical protein
MSAVELNTPLLTKGDPLEHVNVKEGHILVQPVPDDLTPAATLNQQTEEGDRTTSRINDVQFGATNENARRLAATLSLEQQVRFAFFVRSVELGPHCIRLQAYAWWPFVLLYAS